VEGLRDQAERWKYGGHEVTLFGLNSNGVTTGELAPRIESLVGALRAGPRHITRVVLNMSFVIVPCNVPAWLDSIGLFDGAGILAAYQALIAGHPELGELHRALDALAGADPAERDDRLRAPRRDDPLLSLRPQRAVSEFYGTTGATLPLSQQVRARLDNDPLQPILVTLARSGPVAPVGAAGNGTRSLDAGRWVHIRYEFPFAPALWDSVVSASGGEAAGPRAAYSNSGEVVLDGNSRVALRDGGEAPVHGSSFAAPRLSASLAIYLLRGGPSPCEGHLPALGYTNSELDGQHWDDLSLDTASTRYCRGLAALLGPAPGSS
jgi:hypothetical protein